MPKILVLYHYYHPDDVAGARHFTGFCEGMAERGLEVETWPSNRSCHHTEAAYSTKPETLNEILIKRVWRPPFRQHSSLGRIIDAIWVMKVWSLRFIFMKSPDILVIGTDPIFCPIILPFFKWLHPRTKIVHWCFDLYPEYAIADGMVGEGNLLVKFLRWCMGKAYGACDLVVDIGPCMREKLERYPAKERSTRSPWALEEPPQFISPSPAERKELFGDSALGFLYSGNFSVVHDFYLTLKLARLLSDKAVFVYGTRGKRLDELKKALSAEDKNIRFAGFAPPEKLSARLSAPDVHIVSLKPSYTGVAVPSKFFGALAVGRPVLFEGSESSSIARWIKEYQVGWVLTGENLNQIAEELIRFSSDEKTKTKMFEHCHKTYQDHFSKKAVLDNWYRDLRDLVGETP